MTVILLDSRVITSLFEAACVLDAVLMSLFEAKEANFISYNKNEICEKYMEKEA